MIVLTGGAGFIGSCLLAALNRAGRNDVLIVDSLRTNEKWKNIVGHSFIDIVSKEDFRDWMITGDVGDVDVVIHMGACSTTTETDADYLYDNNYRYSVDVAEFAFEHGSRFIYASSAATYGGGERGYIDTDSNLRPLNMYGYSKHLFDQWVRLNDHEGRCVGLKLFNVFGPNEYHKADQASMIFKAFNQIDGSGSVRLFRSNHPSYADGEQMRDFIYIKDVIDVVMYFMEHPTVNGIFNLGTGIARSWNDLAKAVFAALSKQSNIEYIDIPQDIASQYQNFTQADVERLKGAIPGLTFTSLEDAIADYVNGYLRKEWPYFEG